MKKTLLTLLMLYSWFGVSQTLFENDFQKLNKLNINVHQLDLKDIVIQNNLARILHLDQKRKQNKTVAVILTTCAAISIVGGTYLIYEGHKIKEGHDFLTGFGVLSITSGAIYGGVSIPFWYFNKKRKRQRNEVIHLLF